MAACLLVSVLASACSPTLQTVEVTRVVPQTVVVTQLVTQIVRVNITTTPIPADTPVPGTPTPLPTFPPAGIFAIKFYPPLVLDYPTDQWVDKSEYNNLQMMVNFLQNRELESCVIGPMGPSGFWPESTIDKRLGSIDYQAQLDQKTDTGDWISYYFAISAPAGIIDNEIGTAHFFVKSNPAEAKKCRVAAEDVLATLHRSD